MADTPYPKKARHLPSILSPEEVALLIDSAQTIPPDNCDRRQYPGFSQILGTIAVSGRCGASADLGRQFLRWSGAFHMQMHVALRKWNLDSILLELTGNLSR